MKHRELWAVGQVPWQFFCARFYLIAANFFPLKPLFSNSSKSISRRSTGVRTRPNASILRNRSAVVNSVVFVIPLLATTNLPPLTSGATVNAYMKRGTGPGHLRTCGKSSIPPGPGRGYSLRLTGRVKARWLQWSFRCWIQRRSRPGVAPGFLFSE